MLRHALPIVVALLTTALPAESARLRELTEGKPVVVSGAEQYDFLSSINGRAYRIMIAVPQSSNEEATHPVFYVLDGNYYFTAAVATIQARRLPLRPAVIVGIGYPTNDMAAVSHRRAEEFAVSGERIDVEQVERMVSEFIRVLLEEIKPFVEARAKIQKSEQSIYGHSICGLVVGRLLLSHPSSFKNYIASDPSAGSRSRDDPVTEQNLGRRLLVVGRGTDSWLARKVAADTSLGIELNTAHLRDETHGSMSLASLIRGLRFALAPPPRSSAK